MVSRIDRDAARRAAEAARRTAAEAARKAAEAARKAAEVAAKKAAPKLPRTRPLAKDELSKGVGRALRERATKALGASGLQSQASSLLTENATDAKVNCLDLAADRLRQMPADQRARTDVVFLQDTRPGKEGASGHVLLRENGKYTDPVTGKSYDSLARFDPDGHYQPRGVVAGKDAHAILSAPPGSAQRKAALERAHLPPALQSMMVADSGSGAPTVDQGKVELALQTIRADLPLNESQLAGALTNPNLNQAERNAIIQTLAREDGGQLAFFANDASRNNDGGYGGLLKDQRVIGEALQQAFTDGAITADDLLRIADTNGAGNGAQRFLAVLQNGGGGTGGTVEALADALWARDGGDGLDRAAAAIAYSSSPELREANLNTPEARREAFEALVEFNDKAPYEEVGGPLAEQWERSALASSGRLFTAHASELVDYYTGAADGVARTETLSRFISQTLFNPDAQGIWMDRRQDLGPAVRAALGNQADRFLDAARSAPAGSLEQERALAQFGRLTASASGGAALALTDYSEQIRASEESRQQFAGLVSLLVGKTPLGGLPGAGSLSEALAEKIYDAITENPERPDQALAGVLYDSFAGRVEALATELNQAGLRSAFDSAYSAELLNLQQNLNVNLGGHAD
ncbi:MAG: hypothetical protein IT380_18860 [Myxococcales bacterium]|nr:hypothetical protein [Myxococcales bacterium]